MSPAESSWRISVRAGYTMLHLLLGIFAIVAVGGGLAGSYLLFSKEPAPVSPSEAVILPTLELKPVELTSVDLSARIIGQKNGINIHSFTASEARAGFSALGDEHILFTCPSDTSPGIRREVVHGDPYANTVIRYWGYEYSGRENENLEEHREGLALFDGRFYLSTKELEVSGDRYRYLQTENMAMLPNKRYYFMLDGSTALTAGGETTGSNPFWISCLDSDGRGNPLTAQVTGGDEELEGDGVNDATERRNGTDPNDRDSDNDGLTEGEENVNETDPRSIDSDGDGLTDAEELVPGRSPMTADTDPGIFRLGDPGRPPTDPNRADTDGDGDPDDSDSDPDPEGRAPAFRVMRMHEGCTPMGDSCSTPTDCCTGVCSGGLCQCIPNGDSCGAFAGNCCTANCEGGLCQCRPDGQSCNPGAGECCSGNCSYVSGFGNQCV